MLVKADSQFVTPILTAYSGALIRQISENGIKEAEYREAELYQAARHFLENTEQMLRYLLD